MDEADDDITTTDGLIPATVQLITQGEEGVHFVEVINEGDEAASQQYFNVLPQGYTLQYAGDGGEELVLLAGDDEQHQAEPFVVEYMDEEAGSGNIPVMVQQDDSSRGPTGEQPQSEDAVMTDYMSAEIKPVEIATTTSSYQKVKVEASKNDKVGTRVPALGVVGLKQRVVMDQEADGVAKPPIVIETEADLFEPKTLVIKAEDVTDNTRVISHSDHHNDLMGQDQSTTILDGKSVADTGSATDAGNQDGEDGQKDETDDIATVRVELTDQQYLADMSNIDILLVYYCRKCGHGNENLKLAISHTRHCVHDPKVGEVAGKLRRVTNLFRTFSQRSLPLTGCIAPATGGAAANRDISSIISAQARSSLLGKTGGSSDDPSRLTIVEKRRRGRPRKEDTTATPPVKVEVSPQFDEELLRLQEVCLETWKSQRGGGEGSSSPSSRGDGLQPRPFFCRSCPTTVLHNQVEFALHELCHQQATENQSKCRFVCPKCSKDSTSEDRRKSLECNTWNTMASHLTNIHNMNMELACPVCDAVFPNHLTYNKHLRRAHKCKCQVPACTFTSLKIQDVSCHQLCHDADHSGHFRCYLCGWTSDHNPAKWTLMHLHLTNTHPGQIEPLYKCPMCGRGFGEIRRYESHVTSCSKLAVPLKPTCLVCGKLVEEAELIEHLQKHQGSKHWLGKIHDVLTNKPVLLKARAKYNESMPPTEHNDPSQQQSRDHMEDKENTQTEADKDHMSTEAEEAAMEISRSSKDDSRGSRGVDETWPDTDDGEDTVEEEEATAPQPPTVTEAASSSPRKRPHGNSSNGRRGDKKPTGPQRRVLVKDLPNGGVKCNVCYKKFANELRLTKHMARSHPTGGSLPTVCDSCGRSFKTKEQWRNHNRQVHLGIKRKHKRRRPGHSGGDGSKLSFYMCDLCGYATPSSVRLRNHHLSAHLGVFPYSCEKCTYKTNEQSDLRRHLLQHDGVKPWACQHCEYKTQQRWILVNHCQKQHNVTLPKRPHTNSMGGPFSRKRMQSKAATIRNIINTQTGGRETTVSAAVRVKQEAGGSGDPTVEIDGEQYTVQLQGSEVSDTEAVMLLANIAQQQPEVISQLQHSSRHFPGHPLGGGGLGQSEDTDIHQSENTTGLSQSEGTSSLSQSEGAIGLSHSQDSVDMDAAAHGIVIDQSIIDQSENPIVIDQSQIIIMEQSHEENLTHSNEAEVIL